MGDMSVSGVDSPAISPQSLPAISTTEDVERNRQDLQKLEKGRESLGPTE